MKSSKTLITITLLLPIQYIVVQLSKHHTGWVEHYYSERLYPILSKTLRFCLGWIPFSVGDLIGLSLLALFIISTFKWLKNKCKKTTLFLLRITATLSIIYICFYWFWGFNYFRAPLSNSLHLKTSTYTTEELVSTTKLIISKLNAYQHKLTQNDTVAVVVPYTSDVIFKKAAEAYNNLSKQYPQFSYECPSTKTSLISLFQSYNGTSGYLNPITGEAQVNRMIPKTGFPATTCHEIAHQLGWSAENDANFVGFLATTLYNDTYFKYSGYRMAFVYLISDLKKRAPEIEKRLWQSVHKGISKDFRNTYLHWKTFENPIEPYFKKGYNSYLKANNQVNGIESYNYVVDLLIAYDHQISAD